MTMTHTLRTLLRLPATALAAVAATTALLATPAVHATTTLTTTWTDVECGFIGSDGTRTVQPCNGDLRSFTAVVNTPGEAVYVSATLNYTYSDDGLALDRPFFYQTDVFGGVRLVTNESAAIYVGSNNCGRGCPFRPEVVNNSSGPFVLILGDNDTPDSFSGQQNYFASSGNSTVAPLPGPRTAFLSLNATVVQSVSPIPEPQTWALMLAGLGALALGVARRPAPPSLRAASA
jgi:hypothetical protein